MLSLLVGRHEIAEAQEQLQVTLRNEFTDGHPPDHPYPRFTRGKYWYRAEPPPHGVAVPRFLNVFGIVAPAEYQPVVEVNVPQEGRDNRVAGFFARDTTTGATYLMHSGDVGGGQRGMGGEAFRSWLTSKPMPVFDTLPEPRLGFIVMPVAASDATRPLIRYIDSVERFRLSVRDGYRVQHEQLRRQERRLRVFYREPRGRRVARGHAQVDFLSRHGEVVDALHEWRSGRSMRTGCHIAKDQLIDLGIEDEHGAWVELYEVKTNTSRFDIYSAVGQLMIHGLLGCRLVLVLPQGEPLPSGIEEALGRRGISLLHFNLDEQGASIVGDPTH